MGGGAMPAPMTAASQGGGGPGGGGGGLNNGMTAPVREQGLIVLNTLSNIIKHKLLLLFKVQLYHYLK